VILTGAEIERQYEANRIKISGFDKRNLTTNSYDLHLGPLLLRYESEILDPAKDNEFEIFDIPPEGYCLDAGDFVLGHTREMIGSDHFVPLIHARSGTARLGLFVHVTADLIDIGSYGNSTLQLFPTLPVTLYRDMKIAQVTFWVPQGQIKLYEGKYAGARGPLPSLAYRDFART
jgi:dCTP deaminase